MNQFILLTALLGALSICIQFYFSVSAKLEQGFSLLYGIIHYCSYFTFLTNSLVAAMLFSLALFPQSALSLWFKKTTNNTAFAVYVFIVSLIYYTLLLNNHKLEFLETVATHILHGFVPIVFLLLWFFKFRKGDLSFKDCFRWILFPAGYFIYILIRGEVIGAYPYFFLNVGKLGYSMVALYAVAILGIFLISGLGLILVDRKIKINN